MKKNWFVYMIETEKKKIYTGIALDVEKRFETHSSGKGAKYFRMDRPKKIIYTAQFDSKGDALKKEHSIKKLTTIEKKSLTRDSK